MLACTINLYEYRNDKLAPKPAPKIKAKHAGGTLRVHATKTNKLSPHNLDKSRFIAITLDYQLYTSRNHHTTLIKFLPNFFNIYDRSLCITVKDKAKEAQVIHRAQDCLQGLFQDMRRPNSNGGLPSNPEDVRTLFETVIMANWKSWGCFGMIKALHHKHNSSCNDKHKLESSGQVWHVPNNKVVSESRIEAFQEWLSLEYCGPGLGEQASQMLSPTCNSLASNLKYEARVSLGVQAFLLGPTIDRKFNPHETVLFYLADGEKYLAEKIKKAAKTAQ